MREQIYKTLMLKYQYEMEDALLKIDYLMTSPQSVIVEHTDITGEVDKLLLKISEAEGKLAGLRKYCGENKATEFDT